MRSTLFSIPLPEFLQSWGLPAALPIFSYGLLILIAYLVATYWAGKRGQKYGISKDQVQDLTTSALISGIIGARLMHFILYPDYYHSWLDLLKIYEGGLVLYGFILTSPIIVIMKLKKNNISFHQFFMTFSPTLPLGIGIGRLGCFMNGCCYGTAANHAWCVVYPQGSLPFSELGNTPVHPSQLYAFFMGTSLAFLLQWIPKKFPDIKGFQLALCFTLGYGTIRLIEESFRGDTPLHFANTLTAGQATSLGLILVSLPLLVLIRPKKLT